MKIPNANAALVLGEWTWISSNSGPGNVTITPQSVGFELERSYSDKGVCKLTKDGKKEEKLIFEFIEGTTINFAAPDYILKYRNSGLNGNEKYRENFAFQGKDTLVVQRDCEGCYLETYVRK